MKILRRINHINIYIYNNDNNDKNDDNNNNDNNNNNKQMGVQYIYI